MIKVTKKKAFPLPTGSLLRHYLISDPQRDNLQPRWG